MLPKRFASKPYVSQSLIRFGIQIIQSLYAVEYQPQRYKFLAEFARYLRYDILLCNAMYPFGMLSHIAAEQSEVISHLKQGENISHERSEYMAKIFGI